MLFAPYSLLTLFRYIRDTFSLPRVVLYIPYAVLSVLIAAQLYQLGSTSYVASFYHIHQTESLTSFFKSLPQDASVFLYDAPELGVFVYDRTYYQYLGPTDAIQIGAEELPLLETGAVSYVVVPDGVYKSKPDVFAKYVVKKTVNKYNFLVYQ